VVGIIVATLNALGIASATGDIPQNVNFAIKASVAAAFLDAYGVAHIADEGSATLSTPDLSTRAKALTMQVACIAVRPKPVGAPSKSVTAPPPHAVPKGTLLLTIQTRFGQLFVVKYAGDCCQGQISYRAQKIEIGSAAELSPHLDGIYPVKEGDVVVLERPTGARGLPPTYNVLLVDQNQLSDLTSPDFSSEDGTFEVSKNGDDIYFNLGFDKRRRKTATYRDGVLSVFFGRAITTLPKEECATVLNYAARCVTLRSCNDELPFALSGHRYFAMLEQNMPVFKSDKFYEVCKQTCLTKTYNAPQSRKILCGY
jgi:hypothetical protein